MKRRPFSERYPLVSICITSYNYDAFIAGAVRSALTQSYPNIEVVVSDAGSNDDTFATLAAFREDPRVRIYVAPEPLDMVHNHNAAVRYAQGDYVVVLSADDILLPHHIETLMNRMNDVRDPVDIVSAQVTYGDIDMSPIGTPHAHGSLAIDYSGRDAFTEMLFMYTRSLAAMLVPKAAFEALGYFDEGLAHLFEVDFALRLEVAGYRAAVLSDVVAAIRVHPGGTCALRNRDLLVYHREKLAYIEKLLTPDNRWRFEYIGRHIANVLEFERGMIASERFDRETLTRSEAIVDVLRIWAGEHHAWPTSRPRVSVIVHSRGSTKHLLATLDTLWAQDLQSLEMLVVQTDGIGIRHLLHDRPYSSNVRYVKAPHLDEAGGVFRLGIELARAPYVAYFEEGQTAPADQLATLVVGIEQNVADFVCTDAGSLRAVQTFVSSESDVDAPFIPVQRGEVLPSPGALTFSQLLIRRNVLIGTVLFDSITQVGEREFIEAMQFHFQYVFFERRAVTELLGGASAA